MDMKEELLALILKNASNYEGSYEGNGEGLKLIEDLEYDSVDLVNLVLEIEEAFGIQFGELDVLTEKFNDFSDLHTLIVRLKEEQISGTGNTSGE